MSLFAKTAKITAPSDVSHWGGCFAENGFFVLLEVTGEEAHTAASVGKEVLEVLLVRFSNAPKRNLAIIRSLLDETRIYPYVKVAVVGVLADTVLNVGVVGDGVVIMKRESHVGAILSSSGCVSGEVSSGDRLLFSSNALRRRIGDSRVRMLLSYEESDDVVADVAPDLFGDDLFVGEAILTLFFMSQHDSQNVEEEKQPRFTGFSPLVRFSFPKPKFAAEIWKHVHRVFQSRRKKVLTGVLLSLIVLFIASVSLQFTKKDGVEKQKKYQDAIALISAQYEEGVSLIDLNPVRARTLLADSNLMLPSLLSEFSKNSTEYKTLQEWLEKLSQAEVDAYKIYKLTSVPVFFDMTLIREGAKAEEIAAYNETKTILDTSNKTVYTFSSKTKESAMLAGPDTVKESSGVAIHGDRIYVVNSDGVVGINSKTKKSQIVIPPDSEWGTISALASYGGNIYLLDTGKNTIWKYIANENGFSTRQTYLNADVRADFEGARQLLVDGSVWVPTPSSLLKFTQGLGESFSIKGIAETVTSFDALFVSDTTHNLYVLEKELSRVLVFDKDGSYQSQYQWQEMRNATDILASEEEKKLFVLVGSKVYGIELK